MRNSRSMLALVGSVVLAAAFTACVASGAASNETLKGLQERFDRESDAVRKSKLLSKVGDAQFAAVHDAEKAENYSTVAETFEKYRDNVRAALQDLRKQHPDAERQSNGYRQLEMHVGRGIREVNDALLTAPPELLPPLRLVREDLVAMDTELLQLLFPKQPHPKPHQKPGTTPDSKPDSKPDPKEVQP